MLKECDYDQYGPILRKEFFEKSSLAIHSIHKPHKISIFDCLNGKFYLERSSGLFLQKPVPLGKPNSISLDYLYNPYLNFTTQLTDAELKKLKVHVRIPLSKSHPNSWLEFLIDSDEKELDKRLCLHLPAKYSLQPVLN